MPRNGWLMCAWRAQNDYGPDQPDAAYPRYPLYWNRWQWHVGDCEVLLNLGYRISGSDLADSATTQRLKDQGARVHLGHAPENLGDADVVVVSSAVNEENPEVKAARAKRVPVVRRAVMLAELMRFRQGVAVAGTHGKTTTTSLMASVLADQDPTYIIGGRLNAAGTNAKLGQSNLLVAEADESDASFLDLLPMMAVITNIEADHMPTYGGDFEQLKAAFVRFVQNLPFYGLAVVCGDDPVIRELLPRFERPTVTFGIDTDCDYRALDVQVNGLTTQFRVQGPEGFEFECSVNMPGRHNVLNALAVIAVARDLGVSAETIRAGLTHFAGVGRRFTSHGEFDFAHGIHLVDDYGHHPTEVEATIKAARAAYPGRPLSLVFQPHRFSRTRDCFDDFVQVLEGVDQLTLLDVYPAGEAPIAHADSRALAHALRVRGKVDPMVVAKPEEVSSTLMPVLMAGCILITQGAGDVGRLPDLLKRAMESGA